MNILYLLLDLVLLLLICLYYVYVYFTEREKKLKVQLRNSTTQQNEKKYALLMWWSEIGAAKNLVAKEREQFRGIDRDDYDRTFYQKLFRYDEISVFRKMINDRLYCFSSRLLKEFPELTEKEELLIYFYLLNLDDETIILLSEYSPSSLPKIKNRLCKKLLLSNASLLRRFLQERI